MGGFPINATGCDVLTLVSVERPRSSESTILSFDEFHVNRKPLSGFLPVGSLVGVFGALPPKEEKRFARQLVLRDPSEFPGGFVPIYVCSRCGDLGCGCISVRVRIQEGCVVWSDFGRDGVPFGPGEQVGPLRELWFDRTEYRSTLSAFC